MRVSEFQLDVHAKSELECLQGSDPFLSSHHEKSPVPVGEPAGCPRSLRLCCTALQAAFPVPSTMMEAGFMATETLD